MGLRRKGTKHERARRGTTKLRGFQTWTRHVYDREGNPQTITIRVPDGYEACVFGWQITGGFFETLDDEGLCDG